VKPKCSGRSAQPEGCPAPAVFQVGRHGKELPRYQSRAACGRHLSWLVSHMAGPGQTVTVTRLAADVSPTERRGVRPRSVAVGPVDVSRTAP
jgi:hypothetical protein